MKLKKRYRVSCRATAEQDHNLDVYAKSHRLTRSQAIQRVLDSISADVQLKQPKLAYRRQAPNHVVQSNAQLITSLNGLLEQSRDNYLRTDDLIRILERLASKLDKTKLNHRLIKSLASAFSSIGDETRNNRDDDRYIYFSLKNIEKGLD